MLPEIELELSGIHNDELFFDDNHELMHGLVQKNPVYLALDLPGLQTQVFICFPAPCTTRIYAGRIHKTNLVGEVADKYNIYEAPQDVSYRYGMRIVPWMFYSLLDPETHKLRAERDNIVNYTVLNSNVGHCGVLIRVFREHDFSKKWREWFEIYHFDTGNDYQFAEKWRDDPNTKMVARFVTEIGHASHQRTWHPEKTPEVEIGATVPH